MKNLKNLNEQTLKEEELDNVNGGTNITGGGSNSGEEHKTVNVQNPFSIQ